MSVLYGEPFVEVTRSGIVESVHCIAACGVGADGRVVLAIGDVNVPVYLRSTAKPFIASAIVDAGTAERYGFKPYEIAVIASSHSGEPFHIAAVRSVLNKVGLDESALQCGAEGGGYPADPIYNNCSGKHAGILALCKMLGTDPGTYLRPDNHAQRRILEICAQMSGESPENLHVGVDGCGIPVYATSLRNAAQSYRRLATATGITERHSAALRIVREAMMSHPEYVSGPRDFDTELIRAGNGAIACKGGAEGVHGTAITDRGLGLVVKVVDGNSRARAPAVIAALRTMGVLTPEQLLRLEAFACAPIRNKMGRIVGEVRGCPV